MLVVEVAKGYGAVLVGFSLAGNTGAIAAGVAAVAGNVFNMWYRFDGGKGLGISLGVLTGVWPWGVPYAIGLIAVAALITPLAGIAALIAMAGLIVMSILWSVKDWTTGSVEPDAGIVILSVGITAGMAWKHWRDSPLNRSWRSGQKTPALPVRR